MTSSTINDKLAKEIELVNQIPIVSTILEVICHTTNMGFAAIARVTNDRWIACSVRDEIQFGLQPGGELQVETTICNEIRDSRKAVIIDHVALDELYCNHHTPRMYGFESYISMPIILKNGEFFGTLCAIDPEPKSLNNSKTIGLFNLFAELISFHLRSQELAQQSELAIREIGQQLADTLDENRRYRYISNHDLQEPLRKMRFFSSVLVDASEKNEINKIKDLALKIDGYAQRFSMMIRDISELSNFNEIVKQFQPLDLDEIISDVCLQLDPLIVAKGASIRSQSLPVVYGLSLHIEQVLFHLVSNGLKYSTPDVAPAIRIYSEKITSDKIKQSSVEKAPADYFKINVEDNGTGIEKSDLEKIRHILSSSTYQPGLESFGIGLAYCCKVIVLHGGFIDIQSTPGKGTTFSIILPSQSAATTRN